MSLLITVTFSGFNKHAILQHCRNNFGQKSFMIKATGFLLLISECKTRECLSFIVLKWDSKSDSNFKKPKKH